ncbi:hypothetical protein ES705_48480 [subsurface metagenome]
MKLRSTFTGYEYHADLTTETSASSYGQAVLVDRGTGEAIDQFSACFSVIVSATDDERAALLAAGYVLEGVDVPPAA